MKLRRTSGVLAVVGLTFGVPWLWSQNLGDVARQDRERRSRLSTHAPVLTNDDLARDRILTPELKNRILRTQAGNGAGVPQEAPEVQLAQEPVLSPVTIAMIQDLSRTAVLQPLAVEVIQPAVAVQTLASRTPSYTEPAVAMAAPVEEPVPVSDYNVRSAAVQPPVIEAIPPAALEAQTLASQTPSYTEPAVAVAPSLSLPGEPALSAVEGERPGGEVPETLVGDHQPGNSLGEYVRQLRAYRTANVTVQPLDAGTAEIAVTTHEEGIPLGDFARELRAARVERLELQAPQIAAAESPVAGREEPISLGEHVRQLQLRFAAEPMVARAPAANEAPADAGEPVSLGDYARQLRAVRAVPAYESASITPLPPRTEIKAPEPEISLGEYARQLRMRRSAEEYMRLLAQDDPALAAALPREALAPIRYHEIRSTAAAPSRRARPTLVAPKEDLTPDAQGHIAVTIRRGDSLWKLARIYMGSGARWQSISFLNDHPGSPDLIHAGEVVLIPILDPQRLQGPAVASRFPGRRLR